MGLLDDKIAIVTGAASGIGRAGARLMAEPAWESTGSSVRMLVVSVSDGNQILIVTIEGAAP